MQRLTYIFDNNFKLVDNILNYNKNHNCYLFIKSCNGQTSHADKVAKINIPLYFKWIVQTITFKLCDKTQFKCNGLL